MRQLVLLYGILVSSISAWSAPQIQSVKANTDGEKFTAVYQVSEPIENKEFNINYRPRSIELNFAGASLAEKSIVRVDHTFVDRIYSANKDGKVFSRIILKEGLVAKDYEKRVGFEIKDNKVVLKIADKEVFPTSAAADLDAALDKEVERVLSQDLPEKQTVKTTGITVPIKVSKQHVKTEEHKKESEIPVLTEKNDSKAAETENPYGRMIMSFVVIGLFGAAMAMMTRWWKKKSSKSTDNNKIRMVTQHFLGPRKSLAIVRVAGETMLIGVTDHNISMIKSLSLLDDDDMENIDPAKSFGDVLQAQTAVTQNASAPVVAKTEIDSDEEEDFSFKQIKDRISNRVKEMRPL